MTDPTPTEQIAQLKASMQALEAQRPVLGDLTVDTAMEGLRQKLADLEAEGAPPIQQPTALTFMVGERKFVTIMFADLSGFTALSEKLDPETVRDLMNACFDDLVPVIKRYGGTVDKFIGDEIMAIFGAPITREDDPERALRAALEMMEVMEQFNTKHQTTLGMHIGINSGTVIAGGLGSEGRQEYSVMGDAVNVASRLEGASERGQIFAGPETYYPTAALFEFKTLDPLSLKGKAQPVQVYQLLGLKATRETERRSTSLSSPFVPFAAHGLIAVLCIVVLLQSA